MYYGDCFSLNGDSFRFLHEMMFAVLFWGHAFEMFKEFCEVGRVVGEDNSYILNGIRGIQQHFPRYLHDAGFKEKAGRLARSEFDRIAQVGGMNVHDPRDIPDLVHIVRPSVYHIIQVNIYLLHEIRCDLMLTGQYFQG